MSNDTVYVLAMPLKEEHWWHKDAKFTYVADKCLVVNLKVALAFRNKQDAMNYDGGRGFSWDHGWEVTPVSIREIGPKGTIV